MSRSVKTLLIALGGLALLVGAYFGVTALLPEEPEEGVSSPSSQGTSTESAPSETLYDHDIDTLKEVAITEFDGDVYHIVPGEEGEFVVPELEDFTYYRTYPGTCAQRMAAFPYLVKVADSADEATLTQYGLAEPKGKAVVTFEDCAETVLVGVRDEDEGYYYLKREGEDAVYAGTVGINSYFNTGYLGFMNTSLFYCAEDYRTGIDQIKIVDSQKEDPVCIGKCKEGTASALALSATYCMTYPCVMGANDEALDEGLTALTGFSGEAVVAIVTDETDLSKYGLKEPRYTLSYTYQKPSEEEVNPNPVETYEFLVSDVDEDGYHYVLNSDKTLVMRFPKDMYSFLYWDMESMAGTIFLSPLIKYIDRVTVTHGGKDYVFDLTVADGGVTAVTYQNRQLDVDNFKRFYQVILGTSWSGVGSAEPSAEAYYTVRFDYQDDLDKEDDVMTFKPYSLRQYAVEVNGTGRFTAQKTRVDKLVNDLKKVINNEPILAYMN